MKKDEYSMMLVSMMAVLALDTLSKKLTQLRIKRLEDKIKRLNEHIDEKPSSTVYTDASTGITYKLHQLRDGVCLQVIPPKVDYIGKVPDSNEEYI